jgi:membrane protein DedA with SNARE-associated domain
VPSGFRIEAGASCPSCPKGLHGAVAIVLLCSLLFAEEVGAPLPIPGELTLIAAGLLIAAGGLDPWLFVPLAVASC